MKGEMHTHSDWGKCGLVQLQAAANIATTEVHQHQTQGLVMCVRYTW